MARLCATRSRRGSGCVGHEVRVAGGGEGEYRLRDPRVAFQLVLELPKSDGHRGLGVVTFEIDCGDEEQLNGPGVLDVQVGDALDVVVREQVPEDALLDGRTLPALAAALTARGVTARIEAALLKVAGLVAEDPAFAPVFERFRDVLVSGEERMMKPDPAIFALAIKRFGIDPATALFVDDRADNIAAAEAAGFQGWLFREAGPLANALFGTALAEAPGG